MNLPGRANSNVPLAGVDTFALPLASAFLTCRCTKSPLADLVPAAKLLNCSSALAEALAANSRLQATLAAPMIIFVAKVVFFMLFTLVHYSPPAPGFPDCHWIAWLIPPRSAPSARADGRRGCSRCANDAAPAKSRRGGFSTPPPPPGRTG